VKSTSSGKGRGVAVIAGYRVHLGFYRFYDPPYVYGSLGVSLSNPKLIINVSLKEHSGIQVSAPTEESRGLIQWVLASLNISGVSVTLSGYVEHHVGLGSRTRIIMALLKALEVLGMINEPVDVLARRLGVGSVSAVGMYSFLNGGFVADTGRLVSSGEGPDLLLSLNVPREWRVVLCIPQGRRGLSEKDEEPILSKVRPHPKQDMLYALFTKLITAIPLRDYRSFAKALTKLQVLTGEYFSKYQGGIFCCDESKELARMLERSGALGVGQSSWGPAVYGFVDSAKKARHIASEIIKLSNEVGIRTNVMITSIPAHGHQIIDKA